MGPIVTTIETQDDDITLQVKKLDDDDIWFRVQVANGPTIIAYLSPAQVEKTVEALQRAMKTVAGTVVT